MLPDSFFEWLDSDIKDWLLNGGYTTQFNFANDMVDVASLAKDYVNKYYPDLSANVYLLSHGGGAMLKITRK
jgi:hypothetical protein